MEAVARLVAIRAHRNKRKHKSTMLANATRILQLIGKLEGILLPREIALVRQPSVIRSRSN